MTELRGCCGFGINLCVHLITPFLRIFNALANLRYGIAYKYFQFHILKQLVMRKIILFFKEFALFLKEFVEDVKEDRDGIRLQIKIAVAAGAIAGTLMGFLGAIVGTILRHYSAN